MELTSQRSSSYNSMDAIAGGADITPAYTALKHLKGKTTMTIVTIKRKDHEKILSMMVAPPELSIR